MIRTEPFHLFQFRSSFSYSSYTPPVNELQRKDEASEYISQYIDLKSPHTSVSGRNNISEMKNTPAGIFKAMVFNRKLNSVNGLNNFLRVVNEKLPVGGIIAVRAETMEQRRKRVFTGYPAASLYPYYFYDFLVNRVMPKLKLTSNLYSKLKKQNNRVISLPEILGRLVFAGFKIIHLKEIENVTYFIASKERGPVSDITPSYGFFFRMKRVGKDGKIIRVHKVRTMFPYSEFIQKFVYENFSLDKGGKFNNDFRITGWGRILRKYWLDELPMLLNWVKGDLKIVGLRPLSEHYLSLYNKNLAVNRFTIKPGLIPPFYVDLPKTLEEIMKSEEKYIEHYKDQPLKTDIMYLYFALKNIFFKGARSA